jgi:hypothetical protein
VSQFEEINPQGLKPRFLFETLTYGLKPVPFKLTRYFFWLVLYVFDLVLVAGGAFLYAFDSLGRSGLRLILWEFGFREFCDV